MTKEEWTTRMVEAVRLSSSDRITAATQLRQLLSDTQAEVDSSPAAWELGQCLGFLAQLEEAEGNLKSAAELECRLAEMGKREAIQWQFSSGLAYASAALYRFKSCETELAMSLAQEALAHADAWADPSVIYEELIREVRRVKNERAAKGA